MLGFFKQRKLWFWAGLTITLSSLIVNYVMGMWQEDRYNIDFAQYQSVQVAIRNNNYSDAETKLKGLISSHNNSYLLTWDLAYCLNNLDKYDQALELYKRARILRPALTADQNYLYETGQLYYKLNQIDQARRILKNAVEIDLQSETGKKAAALLAKL